MAGVKVYRWIMVFLSAGVLCACGNNDSLSGLNSDMNDTIISENIDKSEEEAAMQLLKGYDSPVEDHVRQESNVVVSDETMLQMKEAIKKTGYPIISYETYLGMENSGNMDDLDYNRL
ncbi:hypothetical protein [Qiania dongpingensis]|uniref:Uncharacterized protein n=1 Tax=Qiania dongpingensis TaxID=2763669 RepID=A0A7G9G1L6_9FIRM|nr:hypothetical protein [Qiania dongpingensis]QNM04698.1 hypothetical protein H9Q78_09540 [Qiania dongpingensis]